MASVLCTGISKASVLLDLVNRSVFDVFDVIGERPRVK